MIIQHAGYNEGFVLNAEVVFEAHSSSGDYHGEMNHKTIVRWLEDTLIPNLPPKYVLVIDNAAYHNVQVDRRPVRATIQERFTKHSIQWSAGMLEDELFELCKTHPQGPVFVSRLPLNKDKRTHPGSHAVYNSKALARLQDIEVNYWASDIARDEMPEHVVVKSGFRK